MFSSKLENRSLKAISCLTKRDLLWSLDEREFKGMKILCLKLYPKTLMAKPPTTGITARTRFLEF